MNIFSNFRTPLRYFAVVGFLTVAGCATVDRPAPSAVESEPVTPERTIGREVSSQPAIAAPQVKITRQDAPRDASNGSVSKPVISQPVDETMIETSDLWQRLRAGFVLSNLEPQSARVKHFEKWYTKHPKYFERLAERAYWFLPYVLEEVEKRGMPTEIALLPAIESAFRPDATSKSKAAGMWQFMAPTGRRFGLRQDHWMDARRDLVQSTRAALDYLEYLSQEFDGDWELAMASYNAGEGTIGKRVRANKANDLPTNYVYLKLRKETAEYLPRLFAVRNIIMTPEKFGIDLAPLENKQPLKVVKLTHQTDLTVAASFISLTAKQLRYLNFGYKRGTTPPNGPHVLVVPIDEADKMQSELAALIPSQRMQWAHHVVKKGEYLGKIARAHSVTAESVRRANGLSSHLIHPGQELRIPLSAGNYQYAGPAVQSIASDAKKHLVAKGDSLWKISRLYQVALDSLYQWNNISRRTILQPGQTLIVGK